MKRTPTEEHNQTPYPATGEQKLCIQQLENKNNSSTLPKRPPQSDVEEAHPKP